MTFSIPSSTVRFVVTPYWPSKTSNIFGPWALSWPKLRSGWPHSQSECKICQIACQMVDLDCRLVSSTPYSQLLLRKSASFVMCRSGSCRHRRNRFKRKRKLWKKKAKCAVCLWRKINSFRTRASSSVLKVLPSAQLRRPGECRIWVWRNIKKRKTRQICKKRSSFWRWIYRSL